MTQEAKAKKLAELKAKINAARSEAKRLKNEYIALLKEETK